MDGKEKPVTEVQQQLMLWVEQTKRLLVSLPTCFSELEQLKGEAGRFNERMSALERPEAPLASAACSQSTTRPTPRAASACAMLTPLTPPPTMTTSAVPVTRNTLSCAEPAGRFTSGPARCLHW